jgi:drug/metabolite transporter (DMT)-like permease
MTTTGYRLVLAITALSVAHHVDHVLRDVTGWPLEGGFNPFSASLFVYPVIAAGLLLARRGRAGPRFWATLAGGGALFILAVHVGPAAGDSVTAIPDQYSSPVAGVAALAILAAFVAALLAHFTYELRSASRRPARAPARR